MSTGQVQRLEGLLARVQKNRNEPRAASVSAPVTAAALPTPSLARVVTPSPFEDAVESRLSKPAQPAATAPAPVAPMAIPARATSLKPSPAAQPAARPASLKPAAPAAPVAVARAVPVAAPVDPNAPARIATSPAPPSSPIAQVESAHPSMEGLSFGELLRRSLTLRPR